MYDILEMSIDDILLLVKKVIYNAVKSGEAKSGDYFLLDDDGVYIGDSESFDDDVLFYAVKIDDVVDFSKEHPEDYISFESSILNEILAKREQEVKEEYLAVRSFSNNGYVDSVKVCRPIDLIGLYVLLPDED